jgi:hypothetical protein
MHGDFVNEAPLPEPEGWHDMLKDGLISLLPNMPTG